MNGFAQVEEATQPGGSTQNTGTAEPGGNWFTNFPGHVVHWQVTCTALVLVAYIICSMRMHRRFDLEKASIGTLLVKVFAATALPTGILLFLCSFDVRAVKAAQDSTVYLAIAGSVVIFYSLKEILKKLEEKSE